MIDEKEKQDGMKACFDRRIDNRVEREFMRDPLIAYTRAFDDAIGWFKKALWHDVSEMPEKGKAFIFLAESNSFKLFDSAKKMKAFHFSGISLTSCQRAFLNNSTPAAKAFLAAKFATASNAGLCVNVAALRISFSSIIIVLF